MKWIYYPIIFATVVGSFQFIAQGGCGSPPEHGRCVDDFCCPGGFTGCKSQGVTFVCDDVTSDC